MEVKRKKPLDVATKELVSFESTTLGLVWRS